MQGLSRSTNRGNAENLVHLLVARLSRHILWDSLLLFAPPAAASVYIVVLLFTTDRLNQSGALALMLSILGFGVFAVLLRRRPLLPTVHGAAHLVDQKSGGKDHFLTLSTIDPASESSLFVKRLRSQAEGLLDRVDLTRDFPYHVKRSGYWSVAASVVAAVLIYLLMPLTQSPVPYAAGTRERLRELARQMEAETDLRVLAKELEALAAILEDPKTPLAEKQALAEKMEQKIQEQQKKEEQIDNQNLLAQASSALDGMEKQQQAAAGGEKQKNPDKAGGGIQSNAPQDGQGENKETQSGKGEGKGESSAQLSREKIDGGKSAQGNPKEPGEQKNQGGEAKHNQAQPDPNQPGKDPNKEKADKAQGGSKEGAGKHQASAEPPPQGGPQADRFYKPGEGKEGLGGKGYVTVQLPEDVVADAEGASRITKESKNNRPRAQVPVSNIPLPAHIPNAAMEKQQVPIEYRGVIR